MCSAGSLSSCRVDANGDSFISQNELEEWIIRKVQEHFEEAAEENEDIFKRMDPDNNGGVFTRLQCQTVSHSNLLNQLILALTTGVESLFMFCTQDLWNGRSFTFST